MGEGEGRCGPEIRGRGTFKEARDLGKDGFKESPTSWKKLRFGLWELRGIKMVEGNDNPRRMMFNQRMGEVRGREADKENEKTGIGEEGGEGR